MPLTILTLIIFVWLKLLQSEIHLWDVGIESWALVKTGNGKMDNGSDQYLSIDLPTRTTSGWFMYITTNSITLLGRWHIMPTLQMNTMQLPKPEEVICTGGIAREVLGCFPECFSAPLKQRERRLSVDHVGTAGLCLNFSWMTVLKIRGCFYYSKLNMLPEVLIMVLVGWNLYQYYEKEKKEFCSQNSSPHPHSSHRQTDVCFTPKIKGWWDGRMMPEFFSDNTFSYPLKSPQEAYPGPSPLCHVGLAARAPALQDYNSWCLLILYIILKAQDIAFTTCGSVFLSRTWAGTCSMGLSLHSSF